MCGICGIYNLNDKRKIEEKIVDKMLYAIRHRGPDGENKMVNERVALGFNRLSFLDLTGGMQPFFNEDSTISMVCNGEIFNYQELRAELMEKGHVFRTKTDVEVCVHLYEEYGNDFAVKLNGQFAIALYDGKPHRKSGIFPYCSPFAVRTVGKRCPHTQKNLPMNRRWKNNSRIKTAFPAGIQKKYPSEPYRTGRISKLGA